MAESKRSFFSISFDLVLTDKELPYDLFINSSAKEDKERFVRIFPCGGQLAFDDLEQFKNKYPRLYVPEDQRNAYLKSLIDCKNATDKAKTEVIKDSAIHYLNNLFDENKEFTTEVLSESIEGCRESVESMVDVVQEYDVKNLQNLIGDLSFHDFYTYDHSINVSMYCIAILRAVNPQATRDEMVMAGLGGLLHDLGKIRIPTTIINNPGTLSDQDFQVIKEHPRMGAELIDETGPEAPGVDFNVIKRVVLEHHENFNGTGYPARLKAKDIHLYSRITAIADFFDAITTKRSYHEALTPEEAVAVMARSVGKKIDPKIFEVFVSSVNVVISKNSNKELPETFDPCQPQKDLPFEAVKADIKQKDIFGSKDKKKAA